MQTAEKIQNAIDPRLLQFINDEVLPHTSLDAALFWRGVEALVDEMAPRNHSLLVQRDQLQAKIDLWHRDHRDQPFDAEAYRHFLSTIGYVLAAPEPFLITTDGVDAEIADMAGPQLVVPIKNARFALNAANARWGSLYDALYGSDVIPRESELAPGGDYNPVRGGAVIRYAKAFLDEIFPLGKGSHQDVTRYLIHFQQLRAVFGDGTSTGLKHPGQLVGLTGCHSAPASIVLKNNGLHVEIEINRNGSIGVTDTGGIQDILIEAALTTIMDCEDSVAAVDAEDKLAVYRNWLGLMRGDLTTDLSKNGRTITRRLNRDRVITGFDGEQVRLHGRSLMLIRNVGLLMSTELIQDADGNDAPEGIVDAIVTSLIASLDLQRGSLRQPEMCNSRQGSIYIVKPKLHGPQEVAFTVELFGRVESLLGLPRNTLKLGIMDEERRTTVNLKACIHAARERVVFINTGFLDRTGDEIHTSMWAGPFLPKQQIKEQPCIKAYENRNVDAGLECGLPGRAQIGKGMWPMPDEMAQMMAEKISHPQAGATTAWVPSPTAATLHALHYHRINVFAVQQQLQHREPASLADLLSIPLMVQTLTPEQVNSELENNIQGILGYVVRWVDQGIGCSKVPDIRQVGLMEDRATLRISSQHVANWLLHGICNEKQVLTVMQRMAAVVDEQNVGDTAYLPMASNIDESLAFQAARALIFDGLTQPNGYTELLLHHYRRLAKDRRQG